MNREDGFTFLFEPGTGRTRMLNMDDADDVRAFRDSAHGDSFYVNTRCAPGTDREVFEKACASARTFFAGREKVQSDGDCFTVGDLPADADHLLNGDPQ